MKVLRVKNCDKTFQMDNLKMEQGILSLSTFPHQREKFTIRILAVCGKRGKTDMVSQSADKDKKALNRSPSSILNNLIFKNSQMLKMVVFSATHPKKSSTSMQVNSQAQRIHVKNS